ncbi:MAG: hypothetical protein EBT27_00135 [Betaproteobacteria bacterium]|nr:hypothetical protein [Betaproteobacteria bacterium]
MALYLVLSFLLGSLCLASVLVLGQSVARAHQHGRDVQELMSRELSQEARLMELFLQEREQSSRARELLSQEQLLSGEALSPQQERQ